MFLSLQQVEVFATAVAMVFWKTPPVAVIIITSQHSCGNIKLLVTLALQQNFAVLPAENRVRCHTHLWRTKRGFARVFDDASTVFRAATRGRLVSARTGVVECYCTEQKQNVSTET